MTGSGSSEVPGDGLGGNENFGVDPFEGVEYFDGALPGESGYQDYPDDDSGAEDDGKVFLDEPPDYGPGPARRLAMERSDQVCDPAHDRATGDPTQPARTGPVSPRVPTAARMLDLVDFYVTEFAKQPEVRLNLPSATEACAHLLRQVHVMALTAMERSWEHEWTDEVEDAKRWQDPDDLIEDFGPHLESALRDHADLVLTQWYGSR